MGVFRGQGGSAPGQPRDSPNRKLGAMGCAPRDGTKAKWSKPAWHFRRPRYVGTRVRIPITPTIHFVPSAGPLSGWLCGGVGPAQCVSGGSEHVGPAVPSRTPALPGGHVATVTSKVVNKESVHTAYKTGCHPATRTDLEQVHPPGLSVEEFFTAKTCM